jgi:hypothetical protein
VPSFVRVHYGWRGRIVKLAAGPIPGDLERLGEEIAELAAHLQVVTYLLLVRLREFGEREGWSGGFRSCAHWLSWRTGLDLGAAREKVRVAHVLAVMPRIPGALERGSISYAKARALTRVATPANEQELLEVARFGTAAQVEQVVRAWRRQDRLEELERDQRQHEARSVRLHIEEDGMYVLRGRLPPEVGALLERALEAAATAQQTPSPHGREDDRFTHSPAQRRADALAQVAADALRAGGAAADRSPAAADRYQVVVHVDAATLRAGSATGDSAIAHGPHVSAETSRRLSCDGIRTAMAHAANGRTAALSSTRRSIPPALRRALEWRDRGCRFPGCGLRRTDAHHVRHWADGGATKLDNLVLLCRRHHRAVHEEGYRVLLRGDGELLFREPNGRVLPNVPVPPIRTPLIERALTAVRPEPWEPPGRERLDLGLALLALRE